jgi:predicted nucleotidyltransferase
MNTETSLDRLCADVPRICQHPVTAVLLIGSMAEGLANIASDIDLIGIVAPSRTRLRLREHAFEYEGQPGSIVYLTEANLRRRIASLDRLYRDGGHLTDGLATRVANARVLYDPEGIGARLVALAQRYEPAPDTLREMVRVCFGFLHDALGSRAAGDHATAVLMSRAAAAVAVDCFLLRHHERNLKPKWHLRRLQQLQADDQLQSYLRVLGLDRADMNTSTRAVEDTQRLIQSVLGVSDLKHFGDSDLFGSASASPDDRRGEAQP